MSPVDQPWLFAPRGGANFSACDRYRFRLWRDLGDPSTRLAFCMLNPSTADAEIDDPTIRRCIGFARAWGFGAVDVVNLYALRSTDPAGLHAVDDPVGPGNDDFILYAARGAQRVVCAWGTNAFGGRDRAVLDLLASLDVEVVALGVTKGGHPKHPLYVPAATVPVPFGKTRTP